MWLMMQQDRPDTYIVATGIPHTVRELVEIAFSYVGLDYRQYAISDPTFLRQEDKVLLIGDSSKASNILGWRPEVTFRELIEMMLKADLARNGGQTAIGIDERSMLKIYGEP